MIQTKISQGHLIDTEFLSREEIEALMERASYWESRGREPAGTYKGYFAANLFFEPSTRTRISFEVAEKKLGMDVLHLDGDTSSCVKGESFYDTLRTLASIGVHVAVIRHQGTGGLERVARMNPGLSLISAGEGSGAHPTQALLDLYTIQQSFSEIKGLTVAIIGDIRHSRVARSNLWTLRKFGARVVLSGPEHLQDPGLDWTEFLPVDEAIRQADVVMMLRVQWERHQQEHFPDKESYFRKYGLTLDRMEKMQSHAIILHPAPVNRGVEIADELVEHPRSRIFKQMDNGVWIRMAVLERGIQGGWME
ncbi:aspartate carbamoyltransferase catalytic subunit [Kroppenstedtia pulmonis]|uniref:Aspartate carbamoyltransferase n=1 Tax=Kroppenstedtia pulmonis TaxID=1380685 RepID=A0A7D3Y276_9BACL|nr:aspartate carbamoyltransferase catalytic subunit [Kroppenstedtia pulmonis]QKG84743.1 aspartate carbamoyltransferase catalytic subunit [Kroppenstedtia pulmonis]